jgi:hypothetical protein
VAGAREHADAFTRVAGVPVEPAPAWRWDRGDGVDATSLAGAFSRALAPAPSRRPTGAPFTVALVLLALAGTLHVAATAALWGWRKVELARTHSAIANVARDAGVVDATPQSAASDLARRHSVALHRHGRSVPEDAWPRLAQAAPALAALPAGALRSARWSGGAWTLELAPLDEAVVDAFDARLRHAGLGAMSVRTASGVRFRIEGAAS